MKNDLTCGVVRDLLPNYVEGLTSEETRQAVERHLGSCPDCAARLEAMRTQPAQAEAEEAREVEYLKKVRRSGKRRVIAAILATALLLALAGAAKLFVLGEPASREGMSWTVREDDSALDLRVYTTWSGVAYCRWRAVEEGDGVVRLRASKVLPSPIYSSGDYRTRISLEGVREVWLANQLIYQDGVPVSAGAYAIYEAKTPYVGDAPALGAVAEAIGLDSQRWSYTTELHTSDRPYRWTIKFQDHWGDTSAEMWMRYYYGPLMLALVDNLDEVGWTYTTATSSGKTFCEGVLTLEEANARLGELLEESDLDQRWKSLESVKDFAATPAGTQVLYELLWGDLLWEDKGITLDPRGWIETVLPETSPGGDGFPEQE